MDKLRMVLANGDEIAMSEFGVPMHALVQRASNDEILNIWKKMTVENLAHVKIKTSEGTIMNFRKVQLSGVQAIDDHDGAYTAHFYMTGEQVINDDETEAYVAAAKIMLGEEA